MTGVCFVDTETIPCPRCEQPADRLLRYMAQGVPVCNRCYQGDRRRALGIAPRNFRTTAERKAGEARLARQAHQRRRRTVINAYGGACACCGESQMAFLAVDHIDGGGNAHRRSLTANGQMAGSSNFYAWIVRNDFPLGFQVLCHNCNFAKSHGGCPHGNC